MILTYLFILTVYAIGSNNGGPSTQSLIHPLNTGKMAFESALEFLGDKNLIRIDSADYTADPTVVLDTNGQYARETLSGRPAWKVIINNTAINVRPYKSDVHPDNIMNFRIEFILDSLNGNCLLIRAINLGKSDYERCELDTTLPFQFMDIEYRRLPDHYPAIGFSELLGRKEIKARIAHETIGLYISGVNRDRNFGDYNEYSHWILTINGIPRFESGTGLEYTNSRVVINDSNGRCLYCSFLGKPKSADSSFSPIPD